MLLPFKMQKTLATFSLTLILKVRILDILNFLRNAKGYLILQNFWVTRRDKKNKNLHVNCLIAYMFTGLEHEKKIKYKCLNEMKC